MFGNEPPCRATGNRRRIAPPSARTAAASSPPAGTTPRGLWDAASGKAVATLEGHTGWVVSAAFSPDGRRIVTASWRPHRAAVGRRHRQGRRQPGGHTHDVWSAAFSPDGRRIVTAVSGRHRAGVGRRHGQGETAKLEGHTEGGPERRLQPRRHAASSPRPNDDTARVWDAATGRATAKLDGHTAGVYSAAFSPDGSAASSPRLAVHSTTAKRTAPRGCGTPPRAARPPGSTATRILSHSAAFSPDGRRIVTASRDGTARVWDAATGRETATLDGPHELTSMSAAFSPTAAASSPPARTTPRGCGTPPRAARPPLEGHTRRRVGAPPSARRPPHRHRVSGQHRAGVGRRHGGRETAKLGGHTKRCRGAPPSAPTAAASSPLALCSPPATDGTARVWDAATGRETARLEGHTATSERRL